MPIGAMVPLPGEIPYKDLGAVGRGREACEEVGGTAVGGTATMLPSGDIQTGPPTTKEK